MCFLLLLDTSVGKTCKVFLLPASGKTQEPTFECPASFFETQKAHMCHGQTTQRDLSGNTSISPRWRGPPACGHLLSVAITLSPYLNNAISVLFTFTRVPLSSPLLLCSSSFIFKFLDGFRLGFSFQSISLSVSTSTGKNTFSLVGLPLKKTDFRFLNILGSISKLGLLDWRREAWANLQIGQLQLKLSPRSVLHPAACLCRGSANYNLVSTI